MLNNHNMKLLTLGAVLTIIGSFASCRDAKKALHDKNKHVCIRAKNVSSETIIGLYINNMSFGGLSYGVGATHGGIDHEIIKSKDIQIEYYLMSDQNTKHTSST